MDTAHDHGHASLTKLGGQLIGAVGLGGEGGDADQIGAGQLVEVGGAEVLVEDLNIPLGRRLASQDQQAQRLPEAKLVPPIRLDVDDAHQGIERIDQVQAQSPGACPAHPRSLISVSFIHRRPPNRLSGEAHA